MTLTLDPADVLAWAHAQPAHKYDAMLTDPPYGLGFMGRDWDKALPSVEVWRALRHCLKPGALALVFGGSRTFHRLAVTLEDAGFELLDTLCWLHAQGMPKGAAVDGQVDAHLGAPSTPTHRPHPRPAGNRGNGNTLDLSVDGMPHHVMLTEATTGAARQWSGYHTALKPAWEPILLLRATSPTTTARTVLEQGTGALNIDGGRLEAGRFPSNVALDEVAAELLDAHAGTRTSGQAGPHGHTRSADRHRHTYAPYAGTADAGRLYGDSGGASRFYYCAKASPAERDAGLDPRQPNTHPTIKPIDLTRWLATLLLPPARTGGRHLLNPYSGSGSDAVGALLAGWEHVNGCDLDPYHLEVARQRADHWLNNDGSV